MKTPKNETAALLGVLFEHLDTSVQGFHQGAAPSPRLTYLIDRYLREPFRQVVDAVRAGQRVGLVAPDVRPDLLLFLVLGAGSQLFDVTALARESLGIDAGAASTQRDFLTLVRTLLEQGVLQQTAKHRRAKGIT